MGSSSMKCNGLALMSKYKSWLFWIYTTFLVIFFFSYLSFYETYDESIPPLSNIQGHVSSTVHNSPLAVGNKQYPKVAVIYALPTFHDEVVSIFACLYHELGYYVVVYIGNGIHLAHTDALLPFSQSRKRNSGNFYGYCVNKWATIPYSPASMTFVSRADVVVFITYPMLSKGGQKTDPFAMRVLQNIHDEKANTKVVLVAHRSNEILHPMLMDITPQLIPRRNIVMMFLGQHTKQAAKQFIIDRLRSSTSRLSPSDKSSKTNSNTNSISNTAMAVPANSPSPEAWRQFFLFDHIHNNSNLNLHSSFNTMTDEQLTAIITNNFHIEHIYPVVPSDFVLNDRFAVDYNQMHPANYFVDAIASRLRNMFISLFLYNLPKYIQPEDSSTLRGSHASGALRDKSEGGLFVIQGNFGGKHAYRKDPEGTVQCIKQHLEDAILRSNLKHDRRVVLDLIGHLNGEVKLSAFKKAGSIRFLNDLSSQEYYRAIARGRFMLASIADREYFTSRATSSVPAALITGIPLVTSRAFLAVYPCLRDAPVHRYIAQDSECESLRVAVSLSEEQYQMARREIANCSSVLWEQAKQTIEKIV